MERLSDEYITEIGRMADNLMTGGGGNAGIRDRETFDKMFTTYFGTKTKPFKNEKALRNTMFEYLVEQNPKKIYAGNIFKEAGGKNFTQDEKIKAKKQVVSIDEYIRLGAQKADLSGYDTPKGYIYPGRRRSKRIGVKYVTARAIQTKAGIRFIDKKGKYVSVKKVNLNRK